MTIETCSHSKLDPNIEDDAQSRLRVRSPFESSKREHYCFPDNGVSLPVTRACSSRARSRCSIALIPHRRTAFADDGRCAEHR